MGADEGGRHCDTLVVGCGALGAAVSYNLAKRGLDVVTLDRFGLAHEFGSSHGQTRIIRLAYYEDPRYVPLLRRAFESWKELETISGRELLEMTGGLMIGSPDGELVDGVLKSAQKHAIPHRMLSASEASDEYEMLTLDEEMVAVHEESAGVLFPEECIRAFVELASQMGCSFKFSEPMTSWKSSAESVEVETTKGRYSARSVVFCAGGWNARLAPGVIPTQCERQVPLWFSPGGESCFTPERMPVFIMEEHTGSFYYGIPDLGHGVKVARHHGGEPCDPETVRRNITQDDLAPVMEFVTRRLKKLAGNPTASTTCIYTNTPDKNFAIGKHPEDARVSMVSACSGHGFKFASVLGEVVADIATGSRLGYDVAFLDSARFANR